MNKKKYEAYRQRMNSLRGRHMVNGEVYHKHHIIPKCMGGEDDEENLVYLTIEEHIGAHKELANCFDKGAYERNANLSSANVIYVWLNKESDVDLTGKNNPMWGRTHSEHTKQLIGEKSAQKIYSAEYREKLRAAMIGENNHRWGTSLSEETKQKISEKVSGKNHPFYGINRSNTTKKKIGMSQPHRVEVVKCDIDGNEIKRYPSMSEAARDNELSEGNLSMYFTKGEITKYGTYRMLGGYRWMRVE